MQNRITRTIAKTRGIAAIYKPGDNVLIRRPFETYATGKELTIKKAIQTEPYETIVGLENLEEITVTYSMPLDKFIDNAEVVPTQADVDCKG